MEGQALGLSDLPCFVCSGQNYSVLPFGYRFHERDLRGVKCCNCGLIFIFPQPNSAEIKQMYDEDYFTSTDIHRRPHGRSDYFQSVLGDKGTRTYRKRLRLFSEFSRPGRLLDIGCGPGHFLHAAKTQGWDVTGVELSDFAAEFARVEFKLNVITGSFETASLPQKTFDVVFLGDLLEHLPNPKEVLLKIKPFLADQGIVFIEVPAMVNGVYSRFGMVAMQLLRKVKYINLPPYHLIEFTPQNVRSLLNAAGYDLIHLRQDVVSPKDIGLRDSGLANFAKMGLQIINFAVTKLTGDFGDRLTIIAKPKD